MNPLSGTLLLLTAGCFAFALACFIADHALPWLVALVARWFGKRDERWTEYERRCGVNESCILRENHRGPHEEKDFD